MKKESLSRIKYIRSVLKSNGVTLAAFSYSKNYGRLIESDKKFSKFSTDEVHSAILGMKGDK